MSAIPARIPDVGPPGRLKMPTVAERTLRSGLRILAVRRAGIPRVEVRLRVPTGTARPGDGTRERVLSSTMLTGTSELDSVALAQRLQHLGAGLEASAGVEEVALGGSALASRLPELLDLLGLVIADAQYPADEVEVQAGRLRQELTIARSQPTVLAGNALLERLYPKHPYGRGLPEPDAVDGVSALALRRWHRKRLVPNDATLVLVGDLRPDEALAAAAASLKGWSRGEQAPGVPPTPALEPGPTVIVDRPGAVQTNIRVGGPALDRAAPGYASLAVANLIFGGYFSSRLMANIREDKGYSYSPRSSIEHRRQVSTFVTAAEVATAVTTPALVEIRRELERMGDEPVSEAELEGAVRYLTGTLALSLQTQAGLASTLASLVANDLGIEYLRDYPRRLSKVTVAGVQQAAQQFLAGGLVTVLVGDAQYIEDGVTALDTAEAEAADALEAEMAAASAAGGGTGS